MGKSHTYPSSSSLSRSSKTLTSISRFRSCSRISGSGCRGRCFAFSQSWGYGAAFSRGLSSDLFFCTYPEVPLPRGVDRPTFEDMLIWSKQGCDLISQGDGSDDALDAELLSEVVGPCTTGPSCPAKSLEGTARTHHRIQWSLTLDTSSSHLSAATVIFRRHHFQYECRASRVGSTRSGCTVTTASAATISTRH